MRAARGGRFNLGGEPNPQGLPSKIEPPRENDDARRRRAEAVGEKFYFEQYNRDITTGGGPGGGLFVEQTQVEYLLGWFTAPDNQRAIIDAVHFEPAQLDALGDIQIRLLVTGIPVPYFGIRYGRIGTYQYPEAWRIEVPASQTLNVAVQTSINYRQLSSGTDYRFETVFRLFGRYVRIN